MRSLILGETWLCIPSRVEALAAQVDGMTFKALMAGDPLRNNVQKTEPQKGVVFLYIDGMVLQRQNVLSRWLGATTLDVLGAQFRAAIDNDVVSQIVFIIDSPGGSVPGVQEFAGQIFEARGRKKITAFVYGGMMASAAYWIGAAADEVIATPSATDIGSIGAMRMHRVEGSKNVTIFRSTGAANKSRLNPYEALTDDVKAHVVQKLDGIEANFHADMKRFRGLTIEDCGKGDTFASEQAFECGMIDRIAPFDAMLDQWGLQQDLSNIEIEVLPTTRVKVEV